MGEIKSAFEIALERTKGVKADKEVLEIENFKKEGKKFVSVYLNNHDGILEGVVKPFKGKQLQWVKEGMFEALLANLVLPVDQVGVNNDLKVSKGFFEIISDTKSLNSIFKQLEGFFKEYIEQRSMVRKNLEKQFAPRLQKRQAEVSKQLGGNVHLDASADPEFMKYLKDVMTQLEERYSQVLNQVKEELKKMFTAG